MMVCLSACGKCYTLIKLLHKILKSCSYDSSSDCAAKLTIAYQFKKDALEAEKVLKTYSEMEKSENEIYENGIKFEDDEYFEYETLEEADNETSQDSKKGHFEEVHIVDGGGSDAGK